MGMVGIVNCLINGSTMIRVGSRIFGTKLRAMYAVVDVETTGGKYGGITEIAVYQYNGHELTDQFISLINPERPIQPFVKNLTGINEHMLRNAPNFMSLQSVCRNHNRLRTGCSQCLF